MMLISTHDICDSFTFRISSHHWHLQTHLLRCSPLPQNKFPYVRNSSDIFTELISLQSRYKALPHIFHSAFSPESAHLTMLQLHLIGSGESGMAKANFTKNHVSGTRFILFGALHYKNYGIICPILLWQTQNCCILLMYAMLPQIGCIVIIIMYNMHQHVRLI